MANITITRTNIGLPEGNSLAGARSVLFDCFKGFTDPNQQRAGRDG